MIADTHQLTCMHLIHHEHCPLHRRARQLLVATVMCLAALRKDPTFWLCRHSATWVGSLLQSLFSSFTFALPLSLLETYACTAMSRPAQPAANPKAAHYISNLGAALVRGAWSDPNPGQAPNGSALSWNELIRKWGKHTGGCRIQVLWSTDTQLQEWSEHSVTSLFLSSRPRPTFLVRTRLLIPDRHTIPGLADTDMKCLMDHKRRRG